jgi:hypothetical protein
LSLTKWILTVNPSLATSEIIQFSIKSEFHQMTSYLSELISPNYKNNDKYLVYYAADTSFDSFANLVKYGADADNEVYHRIIARGILKDVINLHSKYPINLETTELVTSLIQTNNLAIYKYYQIKGLDMTFVAELGIITAAMDNCHQMIIYLADYCKEFHLTTALLYLVKNGIRVHHDGGYSERLMVQTVKLLVSSGANPSAYHHRALSIAISRDLDYLCKYLVDEIGIDITLDNGKFIYLAVKHNNYRFLRLIYHRIPHHILTKILKRLAMQGQNAFINLICSIEHPD